MTQVDTLSAQAASNYVLSPDAEVFIPQQYKAAAAPVLIPKDASIIPQQFPILTDGGSKPLNRMGSNYTPPIHTDACAVLSNGDVGGWQVPGRFIGGKNYSGKNSNRGGKYNGPRRPVRRQMEEPLYSVPIPAPHPPMLYNRLNYPAATLAADGSNYVYVQYPAAPPGYNFNPPPPPPPLPPAQAPIHGAPPRGHPAGSTAPPAASYGMDPTLMSTGYLPAAPANIYAANTQNYEEWPEMKQTKPSITNNHKTSSTNKVNVGIQKEPSKSGANNNVTCGIQHKTVYEVAVQTDFSEEIANLTLSEMPSSLFGSKKRIRNHSNQWISNLTDSEEKDSDSGYSSPLHRRNLVSNGTHAAPERLVSCSEPAVPLATQPVGFSYAAIAQRPAKTAHRFVATPAVSSTKGPVQDQVASDCKQLEPKLGEENVKKKRKRNRGKKKKGDSSKGGSLSSPGQTQGSSLSNSVSMDDIVLHYEDEEEFPELSASTTKKEQTIPTPRMNYCDMLKNNSVIYPTPSHEEGDLEESSTSNKKDGRITRRWQKRQEIANRAAEEELAEITLEQQMLMQRNIPMKKPTSAGNMATAATTLTTSSAKPPLNTGATPGLLSVNPNKLSAPVTTPGKKSKQPFALDIRAMIDALEKRQEPVKKEVPKEKFSIRPLSGNTLDSTAPIRRGKERETPKTKKPSPLKKVILKEREEKKRLRLLEVDPTGSALDNDLTSPSVPVGLGVVNAESDLSQDAASVKGDHGGAMTPASADLSPVSQTSPISISPLSSGVNSPITGAAEKDVNPAVLKIHSRRFREYCNQILDKDIDTCCTTLLKDLVSFQDRLYHKDPVKAKLRRRIVLGLREVTKHLKLKKLKCVIISPNLEKIQSKGGLDDALNNILNLCTDQNIPFVFALGRRALGRACAKLVPVSVVGIFNYEGSEENFQKLMELTEKARQSYVEMVAMIEKDIQENIPQIYSNTAQIFAHMGHSRTPSGCSGISFASSILSEPISENYPQSEPETDSRGNEIAKREITGRESEMKISPLCLNQGRVSSMMGDIDDGNEADTEDCNDPAGSIQVNSINNINLESLSSADVDREDSADEEDDIGSGNNSMFQEALGELPHIDSIHSATYELNTEILSQHSVRTIGDTSEVMSTHSSKTIGEGSSTIVTDTYSEQGQLDKTANCADSSINLTRVKTVEKDKLIQDWVKASQTRIDEDDDSSEQETAKEEEEENSCASSCGSNKDVVVFPALSSSPVAMALATGVKTPAAASPLPGNILECNVTPIGNGIHSVAASTTTNNTMTVSPNTSVSAAISFELSS